MLKFLGCSPPIYDTDQGRFPEFYFLRHIIPICQEIKSRTNLNNLFIDLDEIVPDYRKMTVFLDELTRWCEIPNHHHLKSIFDSLSLINLEMRLMQLLMYILDKEPVVYQKYRTITYWFFRESLLFGTTSHYLMFCDRMSLFDLTSSCLFILWHIDDIYSVQARKFINIVRLLTSLKQIHKKYLEPVSSCIFRLSRENFAEYRREINNLKEVVH
jgi:hypothetical protein